MAQANHYSTTSQANRPTEESDNPTATLAQPWDIEMSYIDATEFWTTDAQYAHPPTIIQQESNDIHLHPSTYLSSHYSGDLEPGEIIEGFPSESTPPPPFQFTSSSLSSALSLSAISPSTAYVSSPIVARVSEVTANCNNIQSLNLSHSQASSSITFADDVEQTTAPQVYSPPSPRSSPDLSALGAQVISVPVPFDDTLRECDSTYDNVTSDSHHTQDEAQCYPTPDASPHLDQTAQTLANPVHTQEEARNPSRHYRTPAQKKKVTELKASSGVKKSTQKNGMPRLSASLPASSE